MKHVCFSLSLILLLSSCQKAIDLWHKHKPEPPSSKCRIDSIYPINSGIVGIQRVTAAGVHYNTNGYPIYVNYTFEHYGTFQFPVFYQYDAMNRISEIVIPNGSSIPEHLNGVPSPTKYVYEGTSRQPVRDTVFSIDHSQVVGIEDRFYDVFGRVIRVHWRQLPGSPLDEFEVKYAYDQRGNKQIVQPAYEVEATPLEYSDKPSLYSLHPVWNVIYKDYSKNSVKKEVASYTAEGLPFTLNYFQGDGYYGYPIYDAAFGLLRFLGVESGVELRFLYSCSNGSEQ